MFHIKTACCVVAARAAPRTPLSFPQACNI